MKIKTFTTIAAAAALTATPVMAQSIDAERASADIEQAEALEGRNGPGLILALLALGVIIAGIIIAVDDDDDDIDLPVSP